MKDFDIKKLWKEYKVHIIIGIVIIGSIVENGGI